MAKTKSNIKTSFTNTKGEKVTIFKDGTKTRSGGKTEELARLVNKADTLGIDTTQARASLAQDAAEGYKPYKGSIYEANAKAGKRYEPTILSTVGGKAKFDKNILPYVTKMNEGVANLGVPDTITETISEGDKATNDMLKAEYDATLTPEQKAGNDYIASLQREMEQVQKANDAYSKASARTARADISALKEQYNQRKQMLEDSNRAEYKQTQQAFIRGGQAEYSPVMTAGFLSAQEREGQARIGELNDLYMSKVDAINASLEEKEYANVAEEVKAMKAIEEKIRTEVQNQAKIAKAETQAIQDRKNIVEAANYLAKNPNATAIEVYTQLGGVVPFDTIREMMPKPAEDFTLSEGQARYDAQGKLIASRAKTYAPKAPVIPGNMTSGQVSAFNSIVGKYNASPLIAASDRTVVLKNSIEQARNKPNDGATQLNLVYSYIQALDTYQSAVREGELGLVNSIDSKIGKLENWTSQIQNGQIVRPEVTKQIADAAENLVTTIDEGAKRKAKSFESQANTVGLGSQWNQYTSGFEQSYNNPQDYTGVSNADLLGIDEETAFEDPNNIYETP